MIVWPTPLNKNPEKTNAAMIAAVEKGDLTRAERLYHNFKEPKYKIESGSRALCAAFIEKGDLNKAEEYVESAELEDELFHEYLKRREYEKAEKYIGGGMFGYVYLSNNFEKLIKAMCDNGDKEIAKKYLQSKKTELKNASTSYYGKAEGEKKYNERMKQINELISSY